MSGTARVEALLQIQDWLSKAEPLPIDPQSRALINVAFKGEPRVTKELVLSQRFGPYRASTHDQGLLDSSENDSIMAEARDEVFRQRSQGSLSPSIETLVEVLSSNEPKKHPLRSQIALVVDGGGGSYPAVAASSAIRLIALGLFKKDITEAVDEIFASSGGAPIASEIAGKRHVMGTMLNGKYVARRGFLNVPPLPGQPWLNLKTFYRDWMERLHSVSEPSSFESKLSIVATLADPNLPGTPEARKRVFTDFPDSKSLITVLHGTCLIPVLCEANSIDYQSLKICDGGLVSHTPFVEAMQGHNFTVVLANNNFGSRLDETLDKAKVIVDLTRLAHDVVEWALLIRKFEGFDEEGAKLWRMRRILYNDARKKMEQKHLKGDAPYLTVVAHDGIEKAPATLESNPRILEEAARRGAYAVFSAFGIRNRSLMQELYQKMQAYLPYDKL